MSSAATVTVGLVIPTGFPLSVATPVSMRNVLVVSGKAPDHQARFRIKVAVPRRESVSAAMITRSCPCPGPAVMVTVWPRKKSAERPLTVLSMVNVGLPITPTGLPSKLSVPACTR